MSNQSFEDDEVEVSVTIDGVELIIRTFDAEGQHNWVLFVVELPPGRHDLEVTSDTGRRGPAPRLAEPARRPGPPLSR